MQATIDTVATIASTTVTLVVPTTIPGSECGIECASSEEGTTVSVGAGTAAVGEPFIVGSCGDVASVGCWMIELFACCVG